MARKRRSPAGDKVRRWVFTPRERALLVLAAASQEARTLTSAGVRQTDITEQGRALRAFIREGREAFEAYMSEVSDEQASARSSTNEADNSAS